MIIQNKLKGSGGRLGDWIAPGDWLWPLKDALLGSLQVFSNNLDELDIEGILSNLWIT